VSFSVLTLTDIAARYPMLWHMSDPRNIPSILSRGLLSTRRLLEDAGLRSAEIDRLERLHRSENVLLTDRRFGTVVLRDQKPLSLTRLADILDEGTVQDFLASVNRRAFFWPTEKRLASLSSARAYRGRIQVVLVAKTLPVLERHAQHVRLSRVNSGATMRSAPARSAKMFQRLTEYNWSPGMRQIAEVTIEDDVSDIWEHVVRCELWRDGERVTTLGAPFDATLEKRIGDVQLQMSV
jgi:hypothetical protein